MENPSKCADQAKFAAQIHSSENLAEFARHVDNWAEHVLECPHCGASFLAIDSTGKILQRRHA